MVGYAPCNSHPGGRELRRFDALRGIEFQIYSKLNSISELTLMVKCGIIRVRKEALIWYQ